MITGERGIKEKASLKL